MQLGLFFQPGRDNHVLDGWDLETKGGNILERESLREGMHGCDSVIHYAAITAI